MKLYQLPIILKKKVYLLLILAIIILLLSLTLFLRGALPEKTYLYLNVQASEVNVTKIFFRWQDSSGWIINDFTSDLQKWRIIGNENDSSLYVHDKKLCVNVVFHGNHEVVQVSRRINIKLSETPIFMINISVSEGIVYHVRFRGIDESGIEREVWWETSPLDDIPGKSKTEVHIVDLRAFSERAIEKIIDTLTLVEVILDNVYSSVGRKNLKISQIGFLKMDFRAECESWEAATSSYEPFQAAIIEIPQRYLPGPSWEICWLSVTCTIPSNSRFKYEILLLSRRNGSLLQIARGPTFLSHTEVFVDSLRLDFSPGDYPHFGEITLLHPFVGNLSVVIVKRGFDSNGFLAIKVHSLEVLLFRDNLTQNIPPVSIILFMSSGIFLALVVAPIILITCAFKRNCKNFFPLAYGACLRLIIAPFTGHPYDMNVWVQSMRLFYESGVMLIKIFPLPLTYYILLLFYSPYALLRFLGFSDVAFLLHRFGMMEAVFIKVPFFLSDILSLYFLVKILKSIGASNGIAYALSYFLNPLAILLSSVWGMYDGLAILFFLVGLYYSFFEEKPLLGALAYIFSWLTKAFGFLGFISLVVYLIKNCETKKLFVILMIAPITTLIFYLPAIIDIGIYGVIDQFLRGRVGLGSKPYYVASSSYLSLLSLIGCGVEPLYLFCFLIVSELLTFIIYFRSFKASSNQMQYLFLSLKYFIVCFIVFYLLFFRVYEQYYLWITPILILYSYLAEKPGLLAASFSISISAFPLILLGTLIVGIDYYYWLPIKLPADAALISTLPSTTIVLVLMGILNPKFFDKYLRSVLAWVILTCSVSWFSFSLAYYIYYGKIPLGWTWYIISFFFCVLIFSISGLRKILNYRGNLILKKLK